MSEYTNTYMNSDAENIEPEEKYCYSVADTVFAWLSFVFGYLFCRAVPIFENPLGGFLFILFVFTATFIILKIKKVKISLTFTLSAVSAIVLSVVPVITQSQLLVFFAFAYAITTYIYFVYSAFGNSLEPGFSNLIFIDYFKAMFVLPFCSFVNIFVALASGRTKKGNGIFLKILIGILFASIPTAIIIGQLSYDEGFVSILKNIFAFDVADLFSHIGSLILAVPFGMYVFGLFSSSLQNKKRSTITAESSRAASLKIKILPVITACTAVIPIWFVYVVYFISQWKYYVSGFTGSLPEKFGYAEYAREGFFQLCTVSVINLVIIIALFLFMKRPQNGSSAVLKIITSVFCLFTFVLISTAISKLVMYINEYGLTQKRVYAMWLMIVIALVYIVLVLGLFIKKIKTVFVSAAVCVALFALLSLCNINGIIAQYNVDRYINGSLETVDISAMKELGDSAVPSLVYLAEEIEEKAQKEGSSPYTSELYINTKNVLSNKADEIKNEEYSVFSFNVPEHMAKNALAEYGMLK